MAARAGKPGSRKYLIVVMSGLGGAGALWVITKTLVANGMAPERTLLDELLVGLLAALLAWTLETRHETELRRLHHASQLLAQLNHYIRNSLQVILSCSAMHPGPASEEAIRGSVRRIEWVLDKVVRESELFSGTETYMAGEGASELDIMTLLQSQPQARPEETGTTTPHTPKEHPADREGG
jgi:hypothetical protein